MPLIKPITGFNNYERWEAKMIGKLTVKREYLPEQDFTLFVFTAGPLKSRIYAGGNQKLSSYLEYTLQRAGLGYRVVRFKALRKGPTATLYEVSFQLPTTKREAFTLGKIAARANGGSNPYDFATEGEAHNLAMCWEVGYQLVREVSELE